jgi:DNA primase small subunit
VGEKLHASWADEDEEMGVSSQAKWEALRNSIIAFERGTKERVRLFLYQSFGSIRPMCIQSTLKAAVEDIILQYTYPRIDTEVSKHRNHLLKAPFCVHPGTGEHFYPNGFRRLLKSYVSGRVCVPIDPAHVDEFDPETVPSVGQLLQELNNVPNAEPGVEHHSGMSHLLRIPKNLHNQDLT